MGFTNGFTSQSKKNSIKVRNFANEGIGMMNKISSLIILLFLARLITAQEGILAGMEKYAPGFEFNDGIYPNFQMVKNNDPIPAARIVSDVDIFDQDFYEKTTSEKQIVIYDENGVKKILKTASTWGYSRNGALYINVGSAFHRISFVGSISHFVASVTTYNSNYYDPYGYNSYSPYSNNYNRYNSPQSNYSSTDLRQYLLDFESGEVMEYNVESVEVLLMKDPVLADEFQALRNRKKKQMKFVFIRRYNEEHPLYFPMD
jgi:hypothetical protein